MQLRLGPHLLPRCARSGCYFQVSGRKVGKIFLTFPMSRAMAVTPKFGTWSRKYLVGHSALFVVSLFFLESRKRYHEARELDRIG